MVGRLSQELESEEKELMEVKAAFVELSRKYTEGEELAKLKDNVDQMKAEVGPCFTWDHIIDFAERFPEFLCNSLDVNEDDCLNLEELRKDFGLIDTDNSGCLTLEELKAFYEKPRVQDGTVRNQH